MLRKSFFRGSLILSVLAIRTVFGFCCPEKTSCDPCGDRKPQLFESGHSITADQMEAGYNAPGRIDVGEWNFFLQASFIYWQPIQEYAELAYTASAPAADSPLEKRYYNMDFKFKPGFKVAAGTAFLHDNWNVFLQYTRLYMKDKKSYTPNQLVNIPHLYPSSLFVTDTSARWQLDLDIVDFELTRPYYLGLNLIVRPHFGIKGVFIDQKYNQKVTVYDPGDDLIYKPEYRGKSDCWGVGPRLGVGTNWFLWKDIRLFGNGAATIAYSHYKTREHEDNLYTSPDFYNLQTKKSFYCLRPILELVGGLGWGTYFCRGGYHFDFSASYEFQALWSQEAMRFDVIRGDLSINGLTLTARLDF